MFRLPPRGKEERHDEWHIVPPEDSDMIKGGRRLTNAEFEMTGGIQEEHTACLKSI